MADFQLKGMPVWVYAKDVDTKTALTHARLIEGTVGDSFSVDPQTLPGYRFVSSEGTLKGTFDETTMHTATFYYRRDNIAETEQLTDKYLHLLADVQPVAAIEIAEPTGQKLWADSYVKVAQRVATREGKFWYQLSDSRWVPYNMQTMKLTDNDGRSAKPISEWNRPTTWAPKPFVARGTVDYVPGGDVAVYAQPYGREIGRVVHGSRIEISERVDDPSGILWYHVVQHGWISSIYLHLD